MVGGEFSESGEDAAQEKGDEDVGEDARSDDLGEDTAKH